MEFEASFPFYTVDSKKIKKVKLLMRDKKALVVIPTFNENDNVAYIIDMIFEMQLPNLDVLVIDDSSPDGTAATIREKQKVYSGLQLIVRPQKLGLGSAYVKAFQNALKRDYDYIFEMDADFSHDPKEIPNFLLAIQEYDLVIGSRYIQGVNVINWPLTRLILSYGANVYTRIITGMKLKDSTSGYKCFKREVLAAINLDNISSDGYSFQIEMDFKAWKLGFRLKEIPIVFVDRIIGSSKMSRKIIWEAIWEVWRLRLNSIFNKVHK